MDSSVVIPVFITRDVMDDTIGSPASITDRVVDVAGNVLARLSVDMTSLQQCVSASLSLLEAIRTNASQSPKIKVDTVSLQLGISAAGKVGFMGSGIDLELATTIEVVFKVE